MSEEEVKVLVGGKLVTLKELQKQYAEISLVGTPGNVKVIQVLAETEKPLTRHEISKTTKMTASYVATLLKKLIRQGYVIPFQIGRSKFVYYLLSEKGHDFSKKLVS